MKTKILLLITATTLMVFSCSKQKFTDQSTDLNQDFDKILKAGTYDGEDYLRGLLLHEGNEVADEVEYLHPYSIWSYLSSEQQSDLVSFNDSLIDKVDNEYPNFLARFETRIESGNVDSVEAGLVEAIGIIYEFTFIEMEFDSLGEFSSYSSDALDSIGSIIDTSTMSLALKSFGTEDEDDVAVALEYADKFHDWEEDGIGDQYIGFVFGVVAAVGIAWVAGVFAEIGVVAHQYVAVSEYNFWDPTGNPKALDPGLLTEIAEDFD